MKRVHFHTVDVFTDRVFDGNPLAVVPDGTGLSTAEMQAIAREFNLSETTFVLPPDDPAHTRRVRIFTPALEMPFAGHPTLGTAVVLAATGIVPLVEPEIDMVLEEGVGPVPVTVRADAAGPMTAELTAARRPEVSPPPASLETLAALLSLTPADVAPAPAPAVVSCGAPFVFVRLTSRDAVRRAKARLDLWDRVFAGRPEVGVFLFADATAPADADVHARMQADVHARMHADVHARMFAPGAGVVEDPATGSAAAALAGYLAPRDAPASGSHRWIIEQGVEMGRPSRLEVNADLESGVILAVRVAGSVVAVSHGEMLVPALS